MHHGENFNHRNVRIAYLLLIKNYTSPSNVEELSGGLSPK